MDDVNVQRAPVPCPKFPSTDIYSLLQPFLARYAVKDVLIQSSSEKKYTYAEAEDVVERLSFNMHQHGVRAGDRVLLYGQNSVEYVVMILATWRLGAIICPVNHLLTPYDVVPLIKIAEPTFAFTDASTVAKFMTILSEIKSVKVVFTRESHSGCVSYSSLCSPVPRGHNAPRADIDVNDVACIMNSSGTTGLPKGVMLSHQNITTAFTCWTYRHNSLLKEGYQVVLVPISHIYGLILSIGGILIGTSSVLMEQFNLEVFLDSVCKYKVSNLMLVPSLLVLLAKHPLVSNYDLTHLRRIGCGSAPLGEDAVKSVQQRLGFPVAIEQGYGLTETSACCTLVPDTEEFRKISPMSVGFPVTGMEVKVVDIETGKSLGPDQSGEILCKGPHIMKGYANNPDATAAMVDSGGWFHTGDIGYYKRDGSFFIIDRLKDLIKYKGYQVSPAELEDLLLSHPMVADTAVIGVPDPEAGEVPMAWIVRKSNSLTEKEIIDFVAEKVAIYKRLRGGVRFVDAIPKSPTGKILRKNIRKSIKKPKI